MTPSFADLPPDQPLTDPAADTLGRAAFARRIATELTARRAGDRLVVSLNGPAGSGKTTLYHFVRHFLDGGPERPKTVAIDLVGGDCAWVGDCDLLGHLRDRLESAPTPAEATRVASTFQSTARTGRQDDAEATAGAAGATLPSRLRSLAAPVVVFIDHLDRLPPAEIARTCRQLSAGADLPNVIWFLLFARDTIVQALERECPGRGPELLQQLVQVELELPQPPETLLRRELETGLAALLDTVSFPARTPERWQPVFSAAVWPLFSTPRDVKRFLSAFAFQFAAHFDPDERVLEVNPIDLVALEALRLFAHPVYRELCDTFGRRETRLVRLLSGRDDERKEARLEIDGIVEALPLSPRERRAVAASLQHLLPGGTGGTNGGREDWDRDLRLCSPRHSARYFHLGATPDALPARRLIELARAAGNRIKFESLLLQAAAEDVLGEVLERIPPLLGALTEPEVVACSSALAGICDRIPATAPEDLEAGLIRLAGELFGRLQNPLKRETVIANLLEDATRLTGPVLLLHHLRPRTDQPAGAATNCLSIEQFRRLVKPAAERLQESSMNGGIWRSREYGSLIRRWWDWSANRDEIRQWLLAEVRDPERARAWLRAFVAPGQPPPAREMLFQLEELSQFCDPLVVATAAAKAAGDGVDRATARTVASALTPRGTSAGFALRTLIVKLEPEAA